MKANALLALPHPMADPAAACRTEALELSRRQGALAWELRTLLDLARGLAAQGAPARARALLQPIVEQFAEPAMTEDLRIAESLLAAWR